MFSNILNYNGVVVVGGECVYKKNLGFSLQDIFTQPHTNKNNKLQNRNFSNLELEIGYFT